MEPELPAAGVERQRRPGRSRDGSILATTLPVKTPLLAIDHVADHHGDHHQQSDRQGSGQGGPIGQVRQQLDGKGEGVHGSRLMGSRLAPSRCR